MFCLRLFFLPGSAEDAAGRIQELESILNSYPLLMNHFVPQMEKHFPCHTMFANEDVLKKDSFKRSGSHFLLRPQRGSTESTWQNAETAGKDRENNQKRGGGGGGKVGW